MDQNKGFYQSWYSKVFAVSTKTLKYFKVFEYPVSKKRT